MSKIAPYGPCLWPGDPAEKMKDLVRQKGARCRKSLLLYIIIQYTSWGTWELYIGIKLVNASLKKVLAYVIKMGWWFGFFLVDVGFFWLIVVCFGVFLTNCILFFKFVFYQAVKVVLEPIYYLSLLLGFGLYRLCASIKARQKVHGLCSGLLLRCSLRVLATSFHLSPANSSGHSSVQQEGRKTSRTGC